VTKAFLVNALKYVLALGLLAFVIWQSWGTPDDGKGIAYVVQRHFVQGAPINYAAYAAVLCIMFVAVLGTIIRWYFLVRAVGLPFQVGDALRLGLIGFFFSNLLPGGVGGDLVKAVYIAREQDRRAVAVATIIIDRVFAVWAMFWFVALLGLVFWWADLLPAAGEKGLKTIVSVAAAGVVVSVVVWTLMGRLTDESAARFEKRLERRVGRGAAGVGGLFCRALAAVRLMARDRVEKVQGRIEANIGHSVAEFWNAVWMYRRQPRVVALTLAISMLNFVGFGAGFHLASRTLWDGQQSLPSLIEHLLIVPTGLLIQGVPLFPGGAGLAELGFAGLYLLLGYEKASGVITTLTYRIGQLLLGLIGLYIYLGMRPALKQAAGDAPEAEEETDAVPPLPVLKE
jgi:hypothetical protein